MRFTQIADVYVRHNILQPDGIPSLDMSLFEDPVDHTAYFVRSCNNAYTGISRLTDDYHNTTGLISNHSVFEGMALFRHPNGTRRETPNSAPPAHRFYSPCTHALVCLG